MYSEDSAAIMIRVDQLPWWWRWYVPLKHLYIHTRLYNVTSHKMVIVTVTTMRTSNLTNTAWPLTKLQQN